MRVAVVGAGGWGTALGLVLSENGHQVALWGHDAAHLHEVKQRRQNEKYLPGVDLPANWEYFDKINDAVARADAAVIAVPSKAFREVVRELAGFNRPLISVTKGIEYESAMTMSEVLRDCLGEVPVASLSGPTFAVEVARGFPSAIVAAARSAEPAELAQRLFHRPTFRVYTSTDLRGVELGGALKNVIAIAAGVGDGLGFGDNSKAALVTRAVAEIRRLGVACGAQPETFSGLSGIGDLTVTCFSGQSRNRGFGERLGRGQPIQEILSQPRNLAEGYPTARSAYRLARKMQVETPIIDEVYAMLYEGKEVRASLRDLTTRGSKAELDY